MKHLKNSFAAVISASILAMSLTATACGTFAWFTYASRAYVEYVGVAVGARNLETGFISNEKYDKADQYDLEEEMTNDGRYIYWFGHDMSGQAVEDLVTLSGYSYNLFHPVTSGKYALGDALTLYETPTAYKNFDIGTEAGHSDYSHLSLAFRVEDEKEPGKYLANEDIYLSKSSLEMDSKWNIKESIRLHSDDETDSRKTTHLINLTSQSEGSDSVGGILDLNGDGYYDSYSDNGSDYERFYGSFIDNKKIHAESPNDVDSELPEEDRTTFNSRHKAGVYSADLEQSAPEKASYEGLHDFTYKITPIATTSSDENNPYAFLDLTVYSEGWDATVVDSQIDAEFSLNLKFEVALN